MIYTFNKANYTAETHIRELYNRKIELLLDGRNEDELTQRETEILKQLRRNRDYDPRYLYTCFGVKEEAQTAIQIADNLEKLSDYEFMVSNYPYEWMSRLKETGICKVTSTELRQACEEFTGKET